MDRVADRGIDADPNGPQLVFSGGGHSTIRCFQLRKPMFSGDRTPKWEPMFAWQIKNIDSECRVLGLISFPVIEEEQQRMHIVVAGCSDASLTVFGYNDTRMSVHLIAKLDYHRPVLCLERLCVESDEGRRHIVVAGGTNGTVTTFDITAAVQQYLESQLEWGLPDRMEICNNIHGHHLHDPPTIIAHGSKKTEELKAQHVGKFMDFKDELEAQAPLREITGVHQSGVNCMMMGQMDERHWLMATGGDDQAVSVCCLDLTSESGEIEVIGAVKLPFAHGAAVNGIALIDNILLTTGIDARLNVYRVLSQDSGTKLSLKVISEACTILAISDINSMAVNKRDQGVYTVAIVGMGMEVVELDLRE